MRAAVITFPGSNCDEDCSFVLEKYGEFKVDRLWHKDTPDLSVYDLVVLPGGFSYGDYLRCGAIASLSPIMENVRSFANAGGLLLGICNGFQILCELRLVPGALVRNESLSFNCSDIYTRVEHTDSPYTSQMEKGEVLKLPIAHGDGRYIVEESEYAAMKEKGQILLTYVDASGKEAKGSNPNGSVFGIAGACNETHNVFGLMPHPERATDLRSRDGMKFWKSIIHFLQNRKSEKSAV